jgi:hypothetical protein
MPEKQITNRPWLTTPERRCLSCGRDFRAAWGWLFLSDGDVVDLDGPCARRLRYCAEGERRVLVATIAARVESRRERRLLPV